MVINRRGNASVEAPPGQAGGLSESHSKAVATLVECSSLGASNCTTNMLTHCDTHFLAQLSLEFVHF